MRKNKDNSQGFVLKEKVVTFGVPNGIGTQEKASMPKFNIQKPEFYDGTDGRMVLTQKPHLREAFQKQYRCGFEHGSLSGACVVALTTLPMLITPTGFQDFFGISGETWHAIFVLLFVISFCVFIFLLFISIRHWRYDKDPVEEFFSETKKLQR